MPGELPATDEHRRQGLLVSAAGLAAELAAQQAAGDRAGLVIVDCRFNLSDPAAGRRAYLEGHLPGAIHADLDRDLAGPRGPDTGRHPLPDPEMLVAVFNRFGIGAESRVVAYDEGGGMLAARLWWLLRWMGHRNVVLLDGGLAAWLKAGFPVDVTVPAEHRDGRFSGSPGHMPVMDTPAVEAAIARGSIRLLDVRARERYEGRQEPIDPVAGHVPGAVNAPCTDNLDADRRFRGGADLATRLAPLVSGHAGAGIVCMCGSGVTACHGILALELAGIDGAALYPGSWSEWIRSPDRPRHPIGL